MEDNGATPNSSDNPRHISRWTEFPPEPTPVKSEAAEGGGLKGQTLQARARGETMGHEMDLQLG